MTTPTLGSGEALAYTKQGLNSAVWLSGGAPTVLSKRDDPWRYAGGGGSVWVVVGRRVGAWMRYRLTYQLCDCSTFVAEGRWAEKFGRYGIRGKPSTSKWYAANDMWQTLMALEFDPRKPVNDAGPTHGLIAQSIQRHRRLSARDVSLLRRYAEHVTSGWTVFVSYSRQDQQVADAVQEYLERIGVSVFVDHAAIDPGERWRQSIHTGLRQCSVLIVLCSDAADRSRWVKEEVEIALSRPVGRSAREALVKERPLIIPVVLDEGTRLETQLGSYQQLRWWGASRRDSLERLAQQLSPR